MVDLEGRERLERECVCLFNRELVSQPDPILRTRAGMWVVFVCFHPVLAFRIHCFGSVSFSVKMLCCIWRLCSVFFTICSNIFCYVDVCVYCKCVYICVCVCLYVMSVLGSIC